MPKIRKKASARDVYYEEYSISDIVMTLKTSNRGTTHMVSSPDTFPASLATIDRWTQWAAREGQEEGKRGQTQAAESRKEGRHLEVKQSVSS